MHRNTRIVNFLRARLSAKSNILPMLIEITKDIWGNSADSDNPKKIQISIEPGEYPAKLTSEGKIAVIKNTCKLVHLSFSEFRKSILEGEIIILQNI